jgi:DNA replication and repair protein RecF
MIQKIRLTNIRCFQDAKFEFGPGVNLIVGPNGSGKTTILEAAAVFSFGRFQSVERDYFAVKGGESIGRIELEAKIAGKKKNFEVSILDGEKIFKASGKKKFTSEIIGSVKTVFFNPETIDLVSGPPQTRRRELDLTIAQKEARYVVSLLEYRKVLKQRNSLLKAINMRRSASGELDYWDKELSRLAVAIYRKRVDLVEVINREIAEVHSLLVEKEKELQLKFLPSVPYGKFRENLAAVLDRDLHLGLTTIGPHRDDFDFIEGGFALKTGGSRGEQRMAAVAFKVETKKFLTVSTSSKFGIPTDSVGKDSIEPILILDDVFSELDENRRESVTKIFGLGQVIISATDKRVIPEEILGKANIIEL